MITDKDIQKLKNVFATKDDLGKFATKDDLVAFEGRIDKKSATKDDIKALATKKDLHTIADDIVEYIDNTHSEGMKEMKEYVGSLAREVSSVLTNHEGRIKDLEKHSFPTN